MPPSILDTHFPVVATASACACFFLALFIDPTAVMVLAILAGYGFAIAPRPDPGNFEYRNPNPYPNPNPNLNLRRRSSTRQSQPQTLASMGTYGGDSMGMGSATASFATPMLSTSSPARSSLFGEDDPLSSGTVLIFDGGALQGRAPADATAGAVIKGFPDVTGLLRCESTGDFLLDPGEVLTGDAILDAGHAYRLVRGKTIVSKCMRCGSRYAQARLRMTADGQLICRQCAVQMSTAASVSSSSQLKAEAAAEVSKGAAAEAERSKSILPIRAAKFMIGLPFRPVKWLLGLG